MQMNGSYLVDGDMLIGMEVLSNDQNKPVRHCVCKVCGESFAVRTRGNGKLRSSFVPCPNKCNYLYPGLNAATLIHVRTINKLLGIFDGTKIAENNERLIDSMVRLKEFMVGSEYQYEQAYYDADYILYVLSSGNGEECIDAGVLDMCVNYFCNILEDIALMEPAVEI